MVLQNPQHEAFAQLVAKGVDADIAYRKVYPRSTVKNSGGSASRLSSKVRPRIAELQTLSATKTVLTMQERRQFFADVVRTPIADIDEHSPLCQSVKYIESERGSSREFKVPDKLAAVMGDAKLAGELIEKREHSGQIDSNITLTEERRKELIEKRRVARMELHGLQ